MAALLTDKRESGQFRSFPLTSARSYEQLQSQLRCGNIRVGGHSSWTRNFPKSSEIGAKCGSPSCLAKDTPSKISRSTTQLNSPISLKHSQSTRFNVDTIRARESVYFERKTSISEGTLTVTAAQDVSRVRASGLGRDGKTLYCLCMRIEGQVEAH